METKEGYKKTKIGWIPEDWGVKCVDDITEVLLSNVDKKTHTNEKKIVLCNYMDVYNNDYIGASIDFMSATATDQEIEKFTLIKDDVLITKDSETQEDIAQSAVVIEDLNGVLCGYHIAILRPREKKVYGKFLMNSIKSTQVHNYFVKLANGVTRFGLNKASISDALIPLPPLPEQQKIASILTTVDDKISSIDQQIQQTEQLKKGLMEKLLTEGIGHTEFKETKIGRIPESWSVCSGEQITEKITKGSSPKWQGFEYGKDGVLFVTSENVRDGFLDLSVKKFLPLEFNKKQQNSTLKSRDVLINIVGASIGRACLYDSSYPIANINQAICLFRTKKEIDPFFILYFLQNPISVKRLLGTQAGSARQNLSLKDLRFFSFVIPPLQEQKQIAAILSTVDDKIDVLQSKKTSYTTLKKGLMAQLLTGKMRVKL